MKVIEFINPPWVYTSSNERISIMDIKGTPRINAELNDNNEVQANTLDSDCANGSCPVK